MQWVNRFSILLELLSFFLAAPEIVTELRNDKGAWLLVLEKRVELVIKVVIWALPAGATLFLLITPVGSYTLGATITRLDRSDVIVVILTSLITSVPMAILANLIRETIISPRLERLARFLADDRYVRLRALWFGVLFFIVSKVMQLVATF